MKNAEVVAECPWTMRVTVEVGRAGQWQGQGATARAAGDETGGDDGTKSGVGVESKASRAQDDFDAGGDDGVMRGIGAEPKNATDAASGSVS